MNNKRSKIQIIIAILVTIPGIALHIAGVEMVPPLEAFVAGMAILGASFLILWACDVVQLDVSQTLAIALVALIAVLPEYAVDMYFTWMAGQHPEGDYSHYAIANMTGANRLLIGVGWVVIIIIGWVKTRNAVCLEKQRATELVFLAMATIYAFIIPIKGSLAWYDAIVFIAMFVWYIIIASRRPCEECELEGPAELIGALPIIPRRAVTIGLFLFAAGTIILNAEPFSEGLVGTGKMFNINEFLLVQWLAPLASEAPEFIVAVMFALRGQTGLGLGALVSSKLNQWTLLVGMIPAVYALSSKQLAMPIPMDNIQMHEILLTAAQSLLGVVLLSTFRIGLWQGAVLLFLFLGQFFLSPLFDSMAAKGINVINGDQVHMVFSAIYILFALVLIVIQPKRLAGMVQGFRIEIDTCVLPDLDPTLIDQVMLDRSPDLIGLSNGEPEKPVGDSPAAEDNENKSD